MANNISANRVIALACEVYGPEKQLRKAQEECGELIVAINHYLEGREHGLESIIEETADVLVVANELREIVGARKVDAIFKAKITRLYGRIRNLQLARKKKEQANVE